VKVFPAMVYVRVPASSSRTTHNRLDGRSTETLASTAVAMSHSSGFWGVHPAGVWGSGGGAAATSAFLALAEDATATSGSAALGLWALPASARASAGGAVGTNLWVHEASIPAVNAHRPIRRPVLIATKPREDAVRAEAVPPGTAFS
jgi:hypothetical protein